MIGDSAWRSVDDRALGVASNGGELGGETHAELGHRADELRPADGSVVDRHDGRRHRLARRCAALNCVVEIGEGLRRHQIAQGRRISGGEGMNDHIVSDPGPGKKGLRREAAVRCGDGVETAPSGSATGAVGGAGTRRNGARRPPGGRSESWRMPRTERSLYATNKATSANMTVGRSISGIAVKLLAARGKASRRRRAG